jgi:hypothetical protein
MASTVIWNKQAELFYREISVKEVHEIFAMFCAIVNGYFGHPSVETLDFEDEKELDDQVYLTSFLFISWKL